jgi:hypothetical protein
MAEICTFQTCLDSIPFGFLPTPPPCLPLQGLYMLVSVIRVLGQDRNKMKLAFYFYLRWCIGEYSTIELSGSLFEIKGKFHGYI